ncbi:MAG: hypothetical protein R3B91_13785 [Planctomycetaceae bacterium]
MGRLFFESILERDYPTIMGLTLMFSVLTLAGQLLGRTCCTRLSILAYDWRTNGQSTQT